MSEPFVCLCQCLSGGLPRDLIRVARHVVGEGKKAEPDSDQLAMICGRLVANDLIRKLDATSIRWAGRRLPEPQSELLYAIQQIIEPLPDGNALREGIQGILKGLATASGRPNVGEDLAALAELAGYLYYLVTLIEVFTQNLTKKQVIEGATGRLAPAGAFDQLCFARQTLATDSRRAWLTIDAFRKGWKLRPFAYPGAAASVSKLIAGSGPPTWHDALLATGLRRRREDRSMTIADPQARALRTVAQPFRPGRGIVRSCRQG
jgi:hypothetical protein